MSGRGTGTAAATVSIASGRLGVAGSSTEERRFYRPERVGEPGLREVDVCQAGLCALPRGERGPLHDLRGEGFPPLAVEIEVTERARLAR